MKEILESGDLSSAHRCPPREELTGMRDPRGLQDGSRYLPTLDGWRAIAVAIVICDHGGPEIFQWLGLRDIHRLLGHGDRGVDIFFAISGLLICTRLLEEESRSGRISLASFYIRRAFRILPAALLYLLAVAALVLFGLLRVSRLDWFGSLFFFRNYTVTLQPPIVNWWFTSHFWSLSVEEHFYLLLPALLVCLPKWRLRALGALILAVLGWRTLVKYGLGLNPSTYVLWRASHSDCRLDSLLIPAFLAVWLYRPGNRERMRAILPWWAILILAPLYGYLTLRFGSWPQDNALPPFLILSTMLHPNMPISRMLEWAPLRWVGRLSYSLYLWQVLFFCGYISEGRPLGVLERWPVNLLCLAACAVGSYYCVERPLIRVGHALARRAAAKPAPAMPASIATGADAVAV